MVLGKSARITILLTCSVGLVMVYYSSYGEKQASKIAEILQPQGTPNWHPYQSTRQKGYVMYHSRCKMLDPDPWDKSVLKYLRGPQHLVCSKLPLLTYIEQQEDLSNVLRMNETAFNKYRIRQNHDIKCCYRVITRINQSVKDYNISADSSYELSKCADFSGPVLLSNDTEFIFVACQSQPRGKSQGKTVYRDVHAVVPILPEVRPKMKKSKITHKRLNVVILAIDSVSKLNLRRIMPKTLKYLQKAEWVELNGYNKVGENTFPNVMAMLSGEPMRSLEKKCWTNRSLKMDDCPFIWKEYNKKGYVTLYAEDTPNISTFNLLRTGFVEKPTDYYLRPFMVAAHESLRLKYINGLPVCLGPVLVVDHILNYAKRFLRAFNNYNYFSLLWLNSLTHNGVNSPAALDVAVHRFLQDLAKIGTYDNSLVLFLSDHGARFGDIRETFQGFLEERLPFLFIWTPKWFREKYPNKYDNLLVNQNTLTSPYDVYVTIKKLLDETEEVTSTACPKCRGLLNPMPPDRSCFDASVDINWCMCSQFRNLPVQGKLAKDIGTFLFRYIIEETKEMIAKENLNKSYTCSKWKFVRVFRTDEIILPKTPHRYSLRNISNAETGRYEGEMLGPDTKMFAIIIELNPGRSKFESTVLMKNTSLKGPTFAILDPPKRLDGIYKTSKCVEKNIILKHYCYCVKRH